MAKYFIFRNTSETENVHAIAESDAEKNSFFWLDNSLKVLEVSDTDFDKVQTAKADATCDSSNNIIVTDHDSLSCDKAALDAHIPHLIERIEQYVLYNETHSMWEGWNNYYNYLKNLDTSSLTYPMITWEDYCKTNSIHFKSILQLP
tara:strand:- start:210 stop:650 length:441 start_codon:yes stop_codon:yes gene_type:complete